MPELCRFYGVIIKMFVNDHPPAHFHAEYQEHEALFDIRTLEIIKENFRKEPVSWWWSGHWNIVMTW